MSWSLKIIKGDRYFKDADGNDRGNFLSGIFTFWRAILDDVAGHRIRGTKFAAVKEVAITVVNGAAAGTFTLPTGAVVLAITSETPVVIPGTPTNTNLRLGSAANGEQYVADVDVKAAGGLSLTLVAAARLSASNPGAWHYTVASSGGTAADQDGTVNLNVLYKVP